MPHPLMTLAILDLLRLWDQGLVRNKRLWHEVGNYIILYMYPTVDI